MYYTGHPNDPASYDGEPQAPAICDECGDTLTYTVSGRYICDGCNQWEDDCTCLAEEGGTR